MSFFSAADSYTALFDAPFENGGVRLADVQAFVTSTGQVVLVGGPQQETNNSANPPVTSFGVYDLPSNMLVNEAVVFDNVVDIDPYGAPLLNFGLTGDDTLVTVYEGEDGDTEGGIVRIAFAPVTGGGAHVFVTPFGGLDDAYGTIITSQSGTALGEDRSIVVAVESSATIHAEMYDTSGAAVGGRYELMPADTFYALDTLPLNDTIYPEPDFVSIDSVNLHPMADGTAILQWAQIANAGTTNIEYHFAQRVDENGQLTGPVMQLENPVSPNRNIYDSADYFYHTTTYAFTQLTGGGIGVMAFEWYGDESDAFGQDIEHTLWTTGFDSAGTVLPQGPTILESVSFENPITTALDIFGTNIVPLSGGGYLAMWYGGNAGGGDENRTNVAVFDSAGTLVNSVQTDGIAPADLMTVLDAVQISSSEVLLYHASFTDESLGTTIISFDTRPSEGSEWLNGNARDNEVFAELGDDTLAGNHGDDSLHGGRGEDWIVAGEGADDVWGDGGDDTIFGGTGGDTLRGGYDNDYIAGDLGDDSIVGQRNNDYLLGGLGDDTLKGGGGGDEIKGDGGDDFLKGGTYDDTLTGGAGADTLLGNKHNDMLDGGKGDDFLNGGGNADTLEGGKGDDTLKGGAGADTFVFGARSGADVVLDFDVDRDLLALASTSVGGQSASQIANSAQVTDAGLLLDFGGGHQILLAGLTSADGLADAISL